MARQCGGAGRLPRPAGIVAPLGHRLAGLLLAAPGLIAHAGRIIAVRRLAPVGLGTGLIAAASGLTLREVLLAGVAATGGMARLT
jgi:hypothetical protein